MLEIHNLPSPNRRIPVAYPAARSAARQDDADTRANRAQIIDALAPIYSELGVNDGAARLMSYLIARTQTADWATPGQPILVWIKNADLAFTLGCSLAAIKRRLRSLRAAGLIIDKTSPNGARFGARDAFGAVDLSASFGLDLSPVAAQYEKFRALARAKEAEQRRRKAARRAMIAAERDIAALAFGAALAFPPTVAAEIVALATAQIDAAPVAGADAESMMRRAAALQTSLALVDDLWRSHAERQNMTPEGVIDDPALPNTTNEPILSGKGAPSISERRGQAAPQGFAKEGGAAAIPLQLVAHACPALERHRSDAYASWPRFLNAAFAIGPYLGISRPALDEAQAALGQQSAAIALAIILQRAEAGDIESPGGYLRALIFRHAAGELHLRRSLFGLARARCLLQ